MARKKWSPQTEVTPALLKFREKRKWQIALRRYAIEKNPSSFYAPYFGLDIATLRKWFEMQFPPDTTWNDFGRKWQFDHIVPVTFFDFSSEPDLKLCWNFTNIRVEAFHRNKDRSNRLDVLAAKAYFQDLYDQTHYQVCQKMLDRIDLLEVSELVSTEKQKTFIIENRPYLDMIEHYSSFEFELLNSGRSTEEVRKEIEFFKGMGNPKE